MFLVITILLKFLELVQKVFIVKYLFFTNVNDLIYFDVFYVFLKPENLFFKNSKTYSKIPTFFNNFSNIIYTDV